MKKLFLLLSFFCLIGCKENTYIIGQAQQQKAAYTVNVYDDKGDWYETGLLIESLDNKMFVQINDGRHELVKSDKEEYSYMVETEKEVLYVK